MRFPRWPLLSLLFPLLLAGLGQRPVPSTCLTAERLGPAVFVSAPTQSIPQPVHNEATCAFCQAVAFAPHAADSGDRLPEAAGREYREHISSEDRLTHSQSSSPPRSRGPPVLRSV
jgi:hypothetical protein